MDREEKPHTSRKVSRIFRRSTALQRSILYLSHSLSPSLSLSLSLLSLSLCNFVGWTPFGGSLCKKCATQSDVLARVGWLAAHLLVLHHSNFLRKTCCTHHSTCANTPSCRSTLAIEASPWTFLEALEKLQRATEFRGWAVYGVLPAPLPTTSTKKLTILQASN